MKLWMLRESIATTTSNIAVGMTPLGMTTVRRKRKKKTEAIKEAEAGANRASGYMGISRQKGTTNKIPDNTQQVWTPLKSKKPPGSWKSFEKKYAVNPLPNPDERLLKTHRGKGY